MLSALVLSLSPGEEPETLERLARDPRLTLGTPVGHLLPAVLESDEPVAGEEAVRALGQASGVAYVDVVMVYGLDEGVSS